MSASTQRSLAFCFALGVAACAPGPAASPEIPAQATAAPEWVSDPAEYQDHGISAKLGERYFAELGGGDPYAAGVAYPVLLALMELYPRELGADVPAFTARFGLLADPAKPPGSLPIGMHLTRDPITHVDFVVMNCRLCHAERLRLPDGDHIVSGLGSTRARIHAYDEAITRIGRDEALTEAALTATATKIARERSLAWPADMALAIARETVRKLRERARSRGRAPDVLAEGLPGRVATIESFAMAMGLGLGHDGAVGWAKIPDVRSFPYRDTLSWDGSGTGDPVALAAEADFAFGARPAWFASHRHIATSLYLYLRHYERSLPYPGPIDAPLAARGEAVFASKCTPCHGAYAPRASATGARLLRYVERVIPVDVVGTDGARASAVSPEIVATANALPLARGVTSLARTMGYVPPVLLDVWARGSFGHVGQWPTLAVLAMPPAERPRRFVVDLDAPYDIAHVGHAFRPVDARPATLGPGEYFYDATAPGYAVGGHPFLADLGGDDRRAVLELLKTL